LTATSDWADTLEEGEADMQLKLKRTQRSTMVRGKTVFMLDAQSILNEEEKHNVRKYDLGKLVIYNSERSRKLLEASQAAADMETFGGVAKAFTKLAMAKLSLNISINSLMDGHHIECKDLEELLGAEEAVKEACQLLRTYLETAATFDGREEVLEF
jgi:hypothetical protein